MESSNGPNFCCCFLTSYGLMNCFSRFCFTLACRLVFGDFSVPRFHTSSLKTIVKLKQHKYTTPSTAKLDPTSHEPRQTPTRPIGSFTVAIFAYFSAPFQPTFWLVFVTLAEESTKGEQKGDEKWAGKWLL